MRPLLLLLLLLLVLVLHRKRRARGLARELAQGRRGALLAAVASARGGPVGGEGAHEWGSLGRAHAGAGAGASARAKAGASSANARARSWAAKA